MRKFYDPVARFIIHFMATRLARFLADVEASDPEYGRMLRAQVLRMLEE